MTILFTAEALHDDRNPPKIANVAAACVKLWNIISPDPAEAWTQTDDILNEALLALVHVGVMSYGFNTFGWALVDAGLSQDDAETCVDRTLGPRPQKPDVYAENADLFEWYDSQGNEWLGDGAA